MMSLAQASRSAAHWTDEQYKLAIASAKGERGLVVIAEGTPDDPFLTGPGQTATLLGFLIARHLAPEWELENVVVSPSVQRKGIGRQLIDALIKAARETNSDAVFLEVRESNTAARALYAQAGFKQHSRRKSYYSNPIEDAILYFRSFSKPFS